MDLRRRDLLKIIGVTAAGSLLPGCEREVHNLVPYLLPDDEIVPGVANWYASVCQECEAGCGILVRVMEGRAKKIEGNPDHPLNRGKLCARGQAALQGLYNPDRIRGPLKREGDRGRMAFRPISWEEGLEIWVEQLRVHQGHAAMICRPLSGTLGDLAREFLEAIGGQILFHDPSDEVSLRAAHRASFGVELLPHYDLANADYLLSFGAPFLEHWLSPVSFGIGYGNMRQGRPGIRGRFMQVEPRLSLTAVSADRWVPIRPGTEGLLAIGIGLLLLEEGRAVLSGTDRERFEERYRSYSLDQIAQQTEVAQEEIVRLAREFAQASAPIAIGGGIVVAQTNGTLALTAINALNALAGNLGKPGGLQFLEPVPFSSRSAGRQRAGERALLELAESFRAGSKRLLHLYQANPAYALPLAANFNEIFERAAFIVSFSPFLDESTAMADLILPDHTPLESWGDHQHDGLIPSSAVGLAQPVVAPLYDTRPIGDLFLHAARRLGTAFPAKLPWPDFRSMLQERWMRFLDAAEKPDGRRSPEAAWIERLQQGGWWAEAGKPLPVHTPEPPRYEPATFSGSPDEFPLYFHPYPSIGLRHGEGANRPWLQELPDPLTTAVWGSWVEINPRTAQQHGLRQGEVVRVISPYGSLEAPVLYFPGNRPDLISMPLGQGHTAYGRYAAGRGVNPLSIVGPALDPRSGCIARSSTRVRLEPTGKLGKLALLDERPRLGRHQLITIHRLGKEPV